MSPTIYDPAPPTAARPSTAPRAALSAARRVRAVPPPAPTRVDRAGGTRAAAFWRALRATLEGIAHR